MVDKCWGKNGANKMALYFVAHPGPAGQRLGTVGEHMLCADAVPAQWALGSKRQHRWEVRKDCDAHGRACSLGNMSLLTTTWVPRCARAEFNYLHRTWTLCAP